MKQLKLVMMLLISLTIMSCSNEKSKTSVKKQAETFLKNQLKDPKSYENISIAITDSVKESESLSEYLELFYSKDMIELGLSKQSERDSVLTLISNYKNNPKSDLVEYVVIEINYRAKNSFGALDIGKAVIYYFIKTPPNGKQFMIYSNK